MSERILWLRRGLIMFFFLVCFVFEHEKKLEDRGNRFGSASGDRSSINGIVLDFGQAVWVRRWRISSYG